MHRAKANVYVDGFNLYKRSLSGRAGVKWLDLLALAQLALPEFDIQKVYYFTARLKPGATFDARAPQRQQVYLRALATRAFTIEIIYGNFRVDARNLVALPKVEHASGTAWLTTKVLKTEEKGTDVNLAGRLVADLLTSACEIGVVVTNDSDQVGPIKMLTEEFECRVGLLFPFHEGTKANRELRSTNVEFARTITLEQLQASQFDQMLKDTHGEIHVPPEWV